MTCDYGCCPREVRDWFCGAGGAAEGLHRAWPHAHIVGYDIRPMPRYPFDFVQGDAMEAPTEGVDFIWASPPCQGYTTMNNRFASTMPRLIRQVRQRLWELGINRPPSVIENVAGAVRELRGCIRLCGSSFGLGTNRHRYFECDPMVLAPRCQHSKRPSLPIYGKLDGRRLWTRVDGSELRAARTLEEASEAMGIDWMEWDELREAIPPAYGEFIGRQLTPALLERAA